jgi:DNA-binding MarR family transcriptional regulator
MPDASGFGLMMPDLFDRSQARKCRERGGLAPANLAAIVDLDNNCVNTACGRFGPGKGLSAAEQPPMAEKRSRRDRAVPFRRKAARRSSPRPAIAFDVLAGHLGYFVRRLQIWVFQDFIRTLRRIDISPAQFSVLVVIGANRGLSQAELAAALGIERARLVRLLHRLEERGLVQRLRSSADGRRHALQLTPQGRGALTRAKILAAQHEGRLIEKLGAERHAMLLSALRYP